ncbi:hypothetical protein [Aquincola tertiaricarbonis]|uniref:hypothetical protein n=1 Tax=Aquincola tertiaricarbonis TaxID=391953 RepID=UPI000615038D|nr:hypothetical protein [Aquincola tertiaricarbonis]
MNNLARLVPVLAASCVLTGCLVPEKFETAVRFKPDGGYTFTYDGTAVNALAAMEIKGKGSLTAKDDESLKADGEKSAKLPGFKKVSYSGQGRYELRIDEEVPPGQQVRTFKVFYVARDKAGVYTLGAPAMKEKDREEMRSLGIKLNGTAEVSLPSNATVIEHNADRTPGLLSKSYAWKVGAAGAQPMIKFTLGR